MQARFVPGEKLEMAIGTNPKLATSAVMRRGRRRVKEPYTKKSRTFLPCGVATEPKSISSMEENTSCGCFLESTTTAKALQHIKGGSSKWVHETFPEHRLFRWQVKYGAFGVSVSQLDKTIQ